MRMFGRKMKRERERERKLEQLSDLIGFRRVEELEGEGWR